ncbi:MAG: sodium:solute symporter [Planctomycetaceae bacterium]
MNDSHAIDLAVLVGYLTVTVGLGCWFGFRRRSSDEFMAGGHALPGWAVGLSMFGSFVSSISFLANPGKAFADDWNPFVFSLATPVAAAIAVIWFVPFYRRTGAVSAYEHLEDRFGAWARTYAVACFLLMQVARMGTIAYLLALAVSPLTGWPIEGIILITGAVMIVYSIFGGIEAVVWIGVVQSVVLIIGPLFCLVVLLNMIPGGMSEVLRTGGSAGKFDLGTFAPSLTESTFWVVFAYGLAINLANFGVDQSYVQRYVTTPDVRQARRSVWITTAFFVPASAFFFFIGTALFVLSRARPELIPAELAANHPDKVFPYFIAHHLPAGLGGLVVAAVFAAAIDSNLSSMATLTLCDLYKRYLKPDVGERESMWVLRGSTLFWGVAGTAAALAMTRAKTILDVWWELAGIFSGGLLGLFLLGRISQRVGSRAALVGVLAGVATILWMTFSPKDVWPTWLTNYRNPLDALLTMVVGTLVTIGVGLVASSVLPKRYDADNHRQSEPRP